MSAPQRGGRGRTRGRARGTGITQPEVPRPGTSAEAVTGQMQKLKVSSETPAPGPKESKRVSKTSSPPHTDAAAAEIDIKKKSDGNGKDSQAKIGHGPKGERGGVRGRTMRNAIIDTRPPAIVTKKGTEGSPIQLKANFFPLLNRNKWVLLHYDVSFKPDLDDTRPKKMMVNQGLASFGIRGYLFDGNSLFTAVRLRGPDPLKMTVADEKDNMYEIAIHLVSEVSWTDWHTLQIFNIIIRRCLEAMDFTLIGRNYFNPTVKFQLKDHNLELWPGFLTSMRQYENNIMLNVDQSFKVLRTDSVYDLYYKCLQQPNGRKEFRHQIIGTIVLTYYNNKTYRIDEVDFEQNPYNTFRKRDGSDISYVSYFDKRYHAPIRVRDQPLLISYAKPREIRAGMPKLVMLVPELCTMTGLSDAQRENFQLMRTMSLHTCVNPLDRLKKLKEFSDKLRASKTAMNLLKEWDMDLADKVIQFQGRVLKAEQLYMSQNQTISGGPNADWTYNLRSSNLFHLPKMNKLVVISPARINRPVTNFMKMLEKAGAGMGMDLRNYRIFDINDDQIQSYVRMIDKTFKEQKPTMVLVVLTHNSSAIYGTVKKTCYLDLALPCQVILSKTLQSKSAMSIATKLAIQMNCKIGGAPWAMSMPLHTMVVGYDVCRDKVSRDKKAFAGMVASMDQNCTQYYSFAVKHEEDAELSSTMGLFVDSAVTNFKKVNGVIPARILIYRDGVGDGDISYVQSHEVDDVKRRLKGNHYKDTPLRLAFIIVSKRINTKIFRAEPFGEKRDMNPPPGTIVDDVVTLPERYDFFIVSQCVRQGTACPTSYNVIEDTLGVPPDRLQQFTYKLTHMYFNWSGTIRVPAPCQYAHKLAFLTALVLYDRANARLNHTLYFL